ncbi:MAG TPA: hypothetical protein VLF79_02380 [Candidatus Saccharimonadales bacterium]|nr:hypothetical protein [Candidatus Saccharimonadales bacterium]
MEDKKTTDDTVDEDKKTAGEQSLETLESPENSLESAEPDKNQSGKNDSEISDGKPAPLPKKPQRFGRLRQKLNLSLFLFSAVIVVAGVIVLIAFLQAQQSTSTNKYKSQGLSQNALNQLSNTDVTVGSNQSILNVQSSAVFAGQVLFRQNLEVAGNLQVGGTLALNNLTVAGASQFGQTTINKNLAVAGDSAIQGSETISKSLQVNGKGTFSQALSAPQITTGSLQLIGDLVLSHHIVAGGSIPSHSNGGALGGGGTASLSGSDTAGSITINTGGGPAAGCFITINFSAKFASVPHVLVTPVGSAAGGLSYYVNRSTTSFSICDATAPPAGSSFGFDYFIVD